MLITIWYPQKWTSHETNKSLSFRGLACLGSMFTWPYVSIKHYKRKISFVFLSLKGAPSIVRASSLPQTASAARRLLHLFQTSHIKVRRGREKVFEDPEHRFMCFLFLDIIKALFIYPKTLKWLWSSIIVFIRTRLALL